MTNPRYTFEFIRIQYKLDMPIFQFLEQEHIHPIDIEGWNGNKQPRIGDTIIYKKGFFFDAEGNVV